MNGRADPGRRRTPQLLALCLTDVEGSSPLWEAHPGDMSGALDHLDRCIATTTSACDGTVVKARGEGDSHFLVFPNVTGAVRAAADLQRSLARTAWPGDVELRIRVAIHVGEVQTRDADFVGTSVNRAARLRSIAHGGQVVAGAAVVELAGDLVGSDLWFESLGRHRIRDFDGWTEVFQLCGRDLTRDFPPLVTLDTGLPPIAVIVMLDCVDTSRALRADADWRALLHELAALFSSEFAAARGEYIKQLGDGYLALFADPDAALAFARATKDGAARLGIEVRGAITIGRVEFAHHEPIGVAIHEAGQLVRSASPGQFMLAPAAAALLRRGDDLVATTSGAATPPRSPL